MKQKATAQESSREDFVRKGATADDVYNQLKRQIVNGTLAGGSPLRQSAIAEQYGVSKIPVREALRQLESSGFVTFRPRRGAVVAKTSVADLVAMLDVRIALQGCPGLSAAGDLTSNSRILDSIDRLRLPTHRDVSVE